jgi:hypothetical protein
MRKSSYYGSKLPKLEKSYFRESTYEYDIILAWVTICLNISETERCTENFTECKNMCILFPSKIQPETFFASTVFSELSRSSSRPANRSQYDYLCKVYFCDHSDMREVVINSWRSQLYELLPTKHSELIPELHSSLNFLELCCKM